MLTQLLCGMPPSADGHGGERHGKNRRRPRTTNQRESANIAMLDNRRLNQAIDESLLEAARLESLTEPDESDSHLEMAKQLSLAEPGPASQCQLVAPQVDVTCRSRHVTTYTMASTKHGDSSSSGANDNAAKGAPSEQGPAADPQHDHHLLSTAFMNSPIFEEYWPMACAAHKKWQRSHQVTPPTSDGTPPPNEGEESEEDGEAKADADAKKNQSCSLLSSHGP